MSAIGYFPSIRVLILVSPTAAFVGFSYTAMEDSDAVCAP